MFKIHPKYTLIYFSVNILYLSGILNLLNCADDATIPVYSIVAGTLAVWFFFFFSATFGLKQDTFGNNMLFVFQALTLFIHFGVQCWGSSIVLSKFEDWRAGNFVCDKFTYLLSFSTLVSYWILWIGCIGVYRICKRAVNENSSN